MKRTFVASIASVALAGLSLAAQKKLTVKDLPPAVQKTVQEQTRNAEVRNIAKETEAGVAQYEIETMAGGKRRDFNVDTKGNLLIVEEETTIDAIPAAARAAILKKVGAGKLGMVETATKGANTFYEAGYTGKDGKKHEAAVNADGSDVK